MKFAAMLLLFTAPGVAQFHDLAVTDDGSQVYFSTGLRLYSETSQNLPNSAAIYEFFNAKIHRITVPPGINPLPFHVNADGNPQVSADARVFVYTEYSNCYGGSACISYPPSSMSFITVDGQPYASGLQGETQVSRNGRYVLNALRIVYLGSRITQVVELRDLQTGGVAQPPTIPANRRQALTGDGRVLTLDPQAHSLALWSPYGSTPIAASKQPRFAILNDAGTWVVYQSGSQLRSIEIATGREALLADNASNPSISNDGATVLYLAGGQAWTIHPDGTGPRPLTDFPAGVDDAVIAGNGQTAIAATGGRLVSIDLATGAAQELIGVTPTCYPGIPVAVPGSLFPLQGTALVGATTEVPLRLNGGAVPLISVSPTLIWFQVPFETPVAPASLSLDYGSPFNGCSVPLPVAERSPWFFRDSSYNLLLIHQDFSGLIHAQSPARPGEVITTYALGLGAVTPIDQLFPVRDPFACHIGQPDGPALDVPFAGLAPGMIGIYQVNIRMPDPLPSGNELFLECAGGFVPIG